MKSKVNLPADNEGVTFNIEGKDEHTPRRMRITKTNLEKFGFAVGRAGGRAANRGYGGGTHGGAQKEDHGRFGKGRRREG